MANIALTWNPANNANSISQRASAIAKVNGLTPNITSNFSPVNDMAKTITSAIYNTSNPNLVYRFMVETICTTGGPISNTNGIQEQIFFACLPNNSILAEVNGNTIKVKVIKGQYLSVDGVSYPNGTSSIEGAEFTLYNSNNTVLISGPHLGVETGTGATLGYEYIFGGLAISTQYTIRYVLSSTINSNPVRSDASQYLAAPCINLVTTTGTAGNCVEYSIYNPGTQPVAYSYTNCDNIQEGGSINGGETIVRCMIAHSLLYQASDLNVTENGPCAMCFQYVNNTGSAITTTWTACDGTAVNGTIANGTSVCARTNNPPAGCIQQAACVA